MTYEDKPVTLEYGAAGQWIVRQDPQSHGCFMTTDAKDLTRIRLGLIKGAGAYVIVGNDEWSPFVEGRLYALTFSAKGDPIPFMATGMTLSPGIDQAMLGFSLGKDTEFFLDYLSKSKTIGMTIPNEGYIQFNSTEIHKAISLLTECQNTSEEI